MLVPPIGKNKVLHLDKELAPRKNTLKQRSLSVRDFEERNNLNLRSQGNIREIMQKPPI